MSHRVCLILLLAVALVAGLFEVHNLDIQLHARTGQWILEHGQVPRTNVLSQAHADHPAVHDKWAFQLWTHLLLDGLGPNAVIAARLLLLLALFATLAATGRRLGAGPGTLLVFLLLALVAARTRFVFRPGLVSLLLLALTLHATLVARPDGRRLWWLLALQVLWVNVHGYFILGPLCVAAVGLGHLARGRAGRATAMRFGGLALTLALACLLNPAFLEGVLHPFRILADLRAHYAMYTASIEEFRPTFGADPYGSLDRLAFLALALPSLLLLGLGGLRALRGRDAAPERAWLLPALALALLTGVMTLSLRRNMALFAVAVAPLAAAAWGRGWPDRGSGPILAAALALLVSYGELTDLTSVHDGLDRRWGGGPSAIAYPDRGIDFIAEQLPTASVFTGFSYGSTFTGRRWPAQTASTDGNTHGYPTEHLVELMSALSGEDALAFRRIVDRDGHDVALVPLGGRLSAQLIRDSEWALVLLGVREAVYVRRAAMDPAWLTRHDLGPALAAGRLPDVADTPARTRVLGIPRAWVPLAEHDQAALLSDAGYARPAWARARAAVAAAPGHAESLALCGLLTLRLGSPEEARDLLRRSREGWGLNRLEDQALEALAGLGEPGGS